MRIIIDPLAIGTLHLDQIVLGHIPIFNNLNFLEPGEGFEPTANGLQNHCSTTELSWQNKP